MKCFLDQQQWRHIPFYRKLQNFWHYCCTYWLSIQIYICYLQLVPAFRISICPELSQLYKSLQFSCIRQHSVHYVHLGDVDVVSVQHKPEPIPTRPDPASPSPCRVPRSPSRFFDVSSRPFPGDYAGVRAVVVDWWSPHARSNKLKPACRRQ
jgi:hypothetical protein